jgi:hypothetical protein
MSGKFDFELKPNPERKSEFGFDLTDGHCGAVFKE